MKHSNQHDELFDPNNVKHDQMLENLQGNILKGHGRNFTSHLFIRFYKNNRIAGMQWIKNFSERVTSCKKQLKETALFKKNGISGSPFFGFYLTGEGYAYIGDKSDFLSSMKNAKLGDPDVKEWEEGYRQEIHAMILIGDDNDSTLQKQKQLLIDELSHFSEILKIENGNVIRNNEGEGIEHFGYADGISQPLFFKEEIEEFRKKYEDHLVFDPAFPLTQVLVKDSLAENENAFGSFLVFRKLEQDVKGFKKQERQIAEKMELEENEVLGAVLVGRFEDGTPYALSKKDGILDNLTNNFDYKSTVSGKCPFLNHIRAVNERDDAARSMIMARRGIPYGAVSDIEDTEEKKKGLLFMSFQSNIKNQFEASQLRANEKRDPIIGQNVPLTAEASCFGKDTGNEMDFRSFVTLKGGEYFFAPSIHYLKTFKIN